MRTHSRSIVTGAKSAKLLVSTVQDWRPCGKPIVLDKTSPPSLPPTLTHHFTQHGRHHHLRTQNKTQRETIYLWAYKNTQEKSGPCDNPLPPVSNKHWPHWSSLLRCVFGLPFSFFQETPSLPMRHPSLARRSLTAIPSTISLAPSTHTRPQHLLVLLCPKLGRGVGDLHTQLFRLLNNRLALTAADVVRNLG